MYNTNSKMSKKCKMWKKSNADGLFHTHLMYSATLFNGIKCTFRRVNCLLGFSCYIFFLSWSLQLKELPRQFCNPFFDYKMPKLRAKKSAKQIAAFGMAAQKRCSRLNVPDLKNDKAEEILIDPLLIYKMMETLNVPIYVMLVWDGREKQK